MSDRLRRLDALFAERVLKHKIYEMPVKSIWDGTIVREQFIPSSDGIPLGLPHYTRSLDAAWEGAMTLYAPPSNTPQRSTWDRLCEEFASEERCFLFAFKEHGDPHPAEALVLACLRAVGCTEEELA